MSKIAGSAFIAVTIVLAFALTGFGGASSQLAGVSAAPPGQMVPTPDRFARPTLPADPQQADLGGQVYYMVCMACHGDQGQGLTPEWVKSWDLGDQSCWQSKCHAANHPEDGFVLPKYIPPVVGPIMRSRFSTALDLHDYIKKEMPWQKPGSLNDEEYWQLTAYLVSANGFSLGKTALDAQNAGSIHLRPTLQPTLQPTPQPTSATVMEFPSLWAGLLAMIGLVLLFLLVQWARKV
jgi:mono/diheme cytochrome c family protein